MFIRRLKIRHRLFSGVDCATQGGSRIGGRGMDLNLGTKSRTTSRALHVSHSAGPDLLRALAILLVMLWHLPPTATPALLTGLKPFSWIGVDLFFVLSGFLIGTQLLA